MLNKLLSYTWRGLVKDYEIFNKIFFVYRILLSLFLFKKFSFPSFVVKVSYFSSFVKFHLYSKKKHFVTV